MQMLAQKQQHQGFLDWGGGKQSRLICKKKNYQMLKHNYEKEGNTNR